MISGSAKRILIAPLDWGLGHTTRCIPLIRQLIACKCEVVFAGNDLQQTFIRTLFPAIGLRNLAGYEVRYGQRSVLPSVLLQIPRLINLIKEEHRWLLQICRAEHFDGIISDNRYGLWHPEIPSVVMTHQAQVLSGFGKTFDNSLLRLHRRLLSRFHTRWIVDFQGRGNLGAALSQPAASWDNTRFIGWLTQFEKPALSDARRHILVLLSGPEPQRTLLSDILWEQVAGLKQPVVFVEGKASASRASIPDHIRYISRSSGAELRTLLNESTLVICRSGYSTLMDLLLFKKSAILIPTPGQTEQEYLAKELSAKNYFGYQSQNSFNLKEALNNVPPFSFPLNFNNSHEQFKDVLIDWLNEI